MPGAALSTRMGDSARFAAAGVAPVMVYGQQFSAHPLEGTPLSYDVANFSSPGPRPDVP